MPPAIPAPTLCGAARACLAGNAVLFQRVPSRGPTLPPNQKKGAVPLFAGWVAGPGRSWTLCARVCVCVCVAGWSTGPPSHPPPRPHAPSPTRLFFPFFLCPPPTPPTHPPTPPPKKKSLHRNSFPPAPSIMCFPPLSHFHRRRSAPVEARPRSRAGSSLQRTAGPSIPQGAMAPFVFVPPFPSSPCRPLRNPLSFDLRHSPTLPSPACACAHHM